MASIELFDTSYTTKEVITKLSKELDEPSWLLDRRLQAYNEYQNLPFDKDTLFYKYTSFRDFDPKALTPSWESKPLSDIKENTIAFENLDLHLIETNEGLSPKLPEELVRKGIVFDSLHNLIDRDEELAKKVVEKADSISENFDKLGSLSRAFAPNIVVLYVPKGVKVDYPLVKLTALGSHSTAHFAEFIGVFEEDTELTYFDIFQRNNEKTEERQMYSGIETVYVGPNASIKSMQLQDLNRKTLYLMSRIANVDQNAEYRTLSHHQGAEMTRQNSNLDLIGSDSEGYDLFTTFGGGTQRFDVKSELHHTAERTIGQTHARQVMMDRSEAILRGLIVIPETGINADSWLTSAGMTVNKGKVNAIPALQIDQNDVMAAHAASVEPINEELVFYLKSRGIREDTAREMIVKGYFEYVFKILESSEAIQLARSYLDKKWDTVQE